MRKILVSACLLGRPVRYDGSARPIADTTLDRWQREGRIVALCPELAGGFGVPRPQAEIADGCDGTEVAQGGAQVIERGGRDVTALYLAGARAARDLALAEGCRFALLMDGSPSCGSAEIYGGRFDGIRHAGSGVTTALLREAGITVYAHRDLDRLIVRMAADDIGGQ